MRPRCARCRQVSEQNLESDRCGRYVVRHCMQRLTRTGTESRAWKTGPAEWRASNEPTPWAQGLTLGGFMVLLVASAFARWRPHPVLFLLDGVWFAVVAVRLAINILQHTRNNFWFIMVALLIWLSVTGVRHFLRFRGTKIVPLKK